MSQVRSALALLTRLPVARDVTARPSAGVAAFGVVGAILGGAAALPVLLLPAAPTVGAILAIAVLAALSGTLHLDGLGDTADALAAPDPGRAEAARKDPRLGSAGVVAIVLIVFVDAAAIASIGETEGALRAGLAVMAAAAVARGIVPLVALLAGLRVHPDGAGRWFAEASSATATVIAAVTALAVAGVASAYAAAPSIALAAVVVLVLGPAAGWWLIRRRGALDGDLLGATVEVAFAGMLVTTLLATGAGR